VTVRGRAKALRHVEPRWPESCKGILRLDYCNPIFPGSFAFDGYAATKRAGEVPADAASAVAAAYAGAGTGAGLEGAG